MRVLFSFGILLLMLSSTMFSQDLAAKSSKPSGVAIQPRFSVRFDRFSGIGLQYKGEVGPHVRDCILVLSDGRYRREHWQEQIIVGKRIVAENERYEIHVFEGRLTPSEQLELAKIVDSPEFRKLTTPEHLRQSLEFFEGTVLRDREPKQSFVLSEVGDYKPNREVLNPIFRWMKQRERMSGDIVHDAEATNCRPPVKLPASN